LVSVTTWVVTPPLGAGAAVVGGAGFGGLGAVRVGAAAEVIGGGGAGRLLDGDAAGCSRPAGGMIATRRERSARLGAVVRSAADRSAADRSPAARPPSKDAGAALDDPDPFDALANATAVATAAVASAVGRTTQRLRAENQGIGILPADGVGRRAQYGRFGKDQAPRTGYRRWRTVRTAPDQPRCAQIRCSPPVPDRPDQPNG
jgi:hypothetical protein